MVLSMVKEARIQYLNFYIILQNEWKTYGCSDMQSMWFWMKFHVKHFLSISPKRCFNNTPVFIPFGIKPGYFLLLQLVYWNNGQIRWIMDRERQKLLLNIAEILYKRGLITESEKNKMKNIINGNESKWWNESVFIIGAAQRKKIRKMLSRYRLVKVWKL